MRASPVVQTGPFFVRPICLLVALISLITPGARQHKHDLGEEKRILQKVLQHPIILFIPKDGTGRGKKDSPCIQEPKHRTIAQWSGTLTPDPELFADNASREEMLMA